MAVVYLQAEGDLGARVEPHIKKEAKRKHTTKFALSCWQATCTKVSVGTWKAVLQLALLPRQAVVIQQTVASDMRESLTVSAGWSAATNVAEASGDGEGVGRDQREVRARAGARGGGVDEGGLDERATLAVETAAACSQLFSVRYCEMRNCE